MSTKAEPQNLVSDKLRLYKVTTPEGNSIYSELAEIESCFNGDLCYSNVGDKFQVEIVELTPEEYEALPDYEP